MQARHITAELRVEFAKATDAVNRAVMAASEESAAAFAHEAQQASSAAQKQLDALGPTVSGLDDELASLEKFRASFAKAQAMDAQILRLVVENSNVKAERLAFGPAHDAANALWAALDAPTRELHTPDAQRARELALTTILAVREIQVLEAPHIPAVDAAVMNTLEQQMAVADESARQALQQLSSLGKPQLVPVVEAARAALSRFEAVHAEITKLSRHNSNVRSLALALGEKRMLAATCEGQLRVLAEQLNKRTFTGTR
jgi:hypothetical protein